MPILNLPDHVNVVWHNYIAVNHYALFVFKKLKTVDDDIFMAVVFLTGVSIPGWLR